MLKEILAENTNHEISGDVVICLVETLPRYKNHNFFVDNWLTSCKLALKLQGSNLSIIGNAQENRHKKISRNGFRLKKENEKQIETLLT